MKNQVGGRLPDEVLDRPQIQIGVQDLVVAKELDPILRQGSAVLSLEHGKAHINRL